MWGGKVNARLLGAKEQSNQRVFGLLSYLSGSARENVRTGQIV
jgi:hypothetical protein